MHPGNLKIYSAAHSHLLDIRTAESNLAVNFLSIRFQFLYGQLVSEVLRKNCASENLSIALKKLTPAQLSCDELNLGLKSQKTGCFFVKSHAENCGLLLRSRLARPLP